MNGGIRGELNSKLFHARGNPAWRMTVSLGRATALPKLQSAIDPRSKFTTKLAVHQAHWHWPTAHGYDLG